MSKEQKVIKCESGDYNLGFDDPEFNGDTIVNFQRTNKSINLIVDFVDKDCYPHFTLEQAKKLRTALDWCIKKVKEPITYYDMNNNKITEQEALKLLGDKE